MNSPALISDLAKMTYVLSEDAKSGQAEALEEARLIVQIQSREHMEAANPVLRKLQGCVKYMEDSRTEVKAPVLTLGRAIDTAAKDYIEPLQAEANRLKVLVAGFVESQRKTQIEEARETGEVVTQADAGSGISFVETWDFEIEDEVKAYTASPGLFELKPKRAAILAAAKAGFPMPFIRAFKKEGVRVKS